MTISSPEVRAPVMQCTLEDVDPEWWVHEHAGICSRGCPHGLAAHICLEHCALLEKCQEQMMVSGSSEYAGMVLGGLIKTRQKSSKTRIGVPTVLFQSCELCTRNRKPPRR